MFRPIPRKLSTRLLAAAVLAALLAPYGAAQTENPPPVLAEVESIRFGMTAKEVYAEALRSTCWVVLKDGWGTGWVLDAEKGLLVTNAHVVEGADEAEVYFPARDGGVLQREPSQYLRSVTPARATVIDRDPVRDLALLRVAAVPGESRPARLAAGSPEAGEVLRAVGALPQGSEGLWGAISGEVRGVIRRHNGTGQRIMMIESSMPVNRGNSGGAALNESGELAGVVQSTFVGGQVQGLSMLIDVSEVRAYLAEALPLVDPAGPAQLVARGGRRFRAGRYDAALADLNAALKQDPENRTALLGRGATLVRKGEFGAGLADLDAVLKADPKFGPALLQRGLALRGQRRFEDAAAAFARWAELAPADSRPLAELATTHLLAGKPEAAADDLSRAIAVDGRDGHLYYKRGTVRRQLRQFKEAAADFAEAARLLPETADRSLNLLGLMCLEAGDPQAAAEAFAGAAGRNPRNPVYFSNLGAALRRSDRHEQAVRAFSQALKLAPEGGDEFNAAAAYAGRGLARRELKEFDAAIRDLSRAILLDERVAGYWHERGLTRRAAEDPAAEDDFRRAAQLNPKAFGEKTVTAKK